jgi:glycosyltransferase involved in cell wall biosynthesis
VVSLPHTQTTRDYSNCAFATLTRGFARMMMSLGNEVILYSGEDNDVEVTHHVTCITKASQATQFDVRGPQDILQPNLAMHMYEPQRLWWREWNKAVLKQLRPRLEQGDFVCIIGGGVLYPELIQACHGKALVLEYAVGYAGVDPRAFHGFGSRSWQHVVFGLQQYAGWQGRAFDRVIPHYFQPEEFEYNAGGDYLLYLGKLKYDKGVEVASRAAELTGERIIFAGQGPTPIPYGEVRNRAIGPDERRELMAGAKAVLVPSLYVEPFGMVAVEALLSGTPIITSPWGGLGDITVPGVGFQCHTFRDYLSAVDHIGTIDPLACYTEGLKYSEESVRHRYQVWLEDLSTLWDKGWMEEWDGRKAPAVSA